MLAMSGFCPRAYLALVLLTIALAGCFVHPDDSVNQMACSTAKNCPVGYRCDRPTGTELGRCVASSAEGSGGVPGNGTGGAWQEAGQTTSAMGGDFGYGGGILGTGGVGAGGVGYDGGARAAGGAGAGGVGYGGGMLGTGGVGSGGIAAGGGTSGTVDAPTAGGAIGTGGAVGGNGGATGTGGATSAGECAPGSHRCSDDTLLTCDNDGRWPIEGSACPYVCRSNACTGQCKPGTNSCSEDGNTLLTCDADGKWPTTGSACEFVCRNKACSGQCKPGAHSCTKDTLSLLTCDADGNWPATGSECPYVCQNNACTGVCRLPDFRCNNNTPEFCQPDGTYQGDPPCASPFACSTEKRGCVCTLTWCGNKCIDTSVDSRNCGKCDYACPGKCNGGTCQCATQSASNLVKNGGFDTDSLSEWWATGDATFSRASPDSLGCAGSGSLLATSAGGGYVYSPCMSITSSTYYNAGGWVNGPSAGSASIAVEWFSSPDCQSTTELDYVGGTPNRVDAVWNYIGFDARIPPVGTASARLWLAFPSGTQTYFDAFYLSPQPNYF